MNKLKQARQQYPQGTLFYSATENLKSICQVVGRLYYSEENRAIYSIDGMGVIYDADTDTWAKKYE